MTSEKSSRLLSRRSFLTAAAGGIGAALLAACGSAGGNAGSAGAPAAGTEAPAAASGAKVNLKWSSWGNPGEAQRFVDYTKDWNAKHPDIGAEFLLIPNDGYEAKILTQLNAGTAPDVFYAGDGSMSKLIANNTIVELTELLKGPDSKSKPEEFADGLWGAARTPEGKIYGVTVDCNPMVLWYNKKLLGEVGVTELPADMYAKGTWNRAAFQGMLEKLRAANKYGFILDNWWAPYYSWVTTNGGKMYDNEQFVAHEDEKSVEAFKFIADSVQSKLITYAGGLPKGQGADAMFVSQQVGFVGAGRWLLPVFKQAQGLEFDIAPWPANTGKKMEPAGVPTAYMVLNANAKDQAAAFQFLTNFVSKEGQVYRLSGGGNAVPSVSGADSVVTDGNLPANAPIFLEARQIGYANFATEARVPGLGEDITKELETLWLKGGDVQATLQKIAENANAKIAANKPK
jgi:multiple sugar transport system substrate-binding protein